MKKRILALALVIALSFAMGAFANTILQAEDVTIFKGIRVIIDGEELYPKDANGESVPMFTLNGTTYLPVRAISNVFDKRIKWDGENKIVYLGEKPGEKPFMRLKSYYESGVDSADERWVWEDQHLAQDGTMMKNVVYPELQDVDSVLENPAPYGDSPYTANQGGDETIELNGEFKRFTAKFFVPAEASEHAYYKYEDVNGFNTYCEPAMLNVIVWYMNGTVEYKTLIQDKEIVNGDQTFDVDLDITNVKTMEIWLHSGQSHNGKAVQGMLADPIFHR